MDIEQIRRDRIRISMFAYAYDILGEPLVSDSDYDSLAKTLDNTTSTDNEIMDTFFKEEYVNHSGMWIHKHPQLERIRQLVLRYKTISKVVFSEDTHPNDTSL